MSSADAKLKIRRARRQDAPRIAELSTQLGYPVKAGEMAARLNHVLKDKRGACFVAESKDGEVLGWIHVSVTPLLEVNPRAEANALIVDEKPRRRGPGWSLLRAGEQWRPKLRRLGLSVP